MPRPTAKSERFDLFQTITDSVIAALESGTVPWRRTWSSDGTAMPFAFGAHRSVATGKAYRGCNQLLLTVTADRKGYDAPWWMTMRQANALGGRIRKGENSALVCYWTFIEKRAKPGEPKPATVEKIPVLRYFRVFNIAQVDGLPPEVAAKYTSAPVEKPSAPGADYSPAEQSMADTLAAYISRSGVTLAHGGDQPCYSPSRDAIAMPARASFATNADYLSVLAHECAHSTGAPKRLDREGVAKHNGFGTERYSREELVAELAAAFVAGAHGAVTPGVIENRDAYIAGWAKALRSDPRAIVVASGHAQRAAEYMIGHDEQEGDADTDAGEEGSD